jgi:lipopolysaccharide assembly outer membrane protein LptD (OstA)
MLGIVNPHLVALVAQAMLASTLGVDHADEGPETGKVLATWAGKAEIQLELDEEGEISFDSPFQIRLNGNVKMETEHFQLRAERVSYDSASGSLILEAGEADGAQLSLRAPDGSQSLRIVGRKLLFRFRDKTLVAEGGGALHLDNRPQK